MSQVIAKLPILYESYKKWVSTNPQVVGDVETTVKWLSYFLVGRTNNSAVITELIYSLSNLLVLFNDRIIQKAKTPCPSGNSEYKLKLLLTTLDYSEVFIELSATKLWGERGRWLFITIVQVIKCVGRLLLKLHYGEALVQSPPIMALDRKNIDEVLAEASAADSVPDTFGGSSSFTFTLKRSGKVMRKVEGAPPVYLRTWKPLENDPELVPVVASAELQKLKLAEILYIVKPLAHLGGVAAFGFNNWKSYSVALLIDLMSLRLYRQNRQHLTKQQRLELSRRTVSLLLYLMRSPFYDKYSKDKINALLRAVSCAIPFSKLICNPIMDYIPQWQRTYFYMWST